MDPHPQHIHIEQLDDVTDHSHYRYEAYGSYEPKDSLEQSDASTFVGSNSSRLHRPFSAVTAAEDFNETASGTRIDCCDKKSLWYRFTHSETGRLICSFLFFTVICIGMAFCNQISDHRWVDTSYTKVLLRDRGFDVIEAQADIQPANTFVMTSVVFTVLGIGLICPNWTMRAIALRRVLWVIGILGAYRSITLSVTTLPTPKEECRPSLKTGFWDMFIVALQMIPGTVEACTDDIFSGHTVFMVSCAIQWRLYCKNKWVTYFSYIYISIGLYFVVATRLHYTVDVVLAVFITFAVWSLYIGMIDVVMEHEYFGIESHHEKYRVFDSITTEYEFAQDDDNDDISVGHAALRVKRRQLEHMLNRLRGPRIGYGQGEYDRVAFLPVQFNTWFRSIIRWCDGLDLRMRPAECTRTEASRWEEFVVKYRSEQVSGSRIRRKAYEGLDECDDEEMFEVSRGSVLESVRIHEYSNIEARQQQQGRWRSMPLRSGSPRPRSSNLKENTDDKINRNRKLRILKIGLIILVNVILLVKVVQAIQSRANSAPPSHWPQEMESYPGGAIYTNDTNTPGPITGAGPEDHHHQQQQQQQQEQQQQPPVNHGHVEHNPLNGQEDIKTTPNEPRVRRRHVQP